MFDWVVKAAALTYLGKTTNNPDIVMLPPELVVRFWPRLERLLRSAVKPQTGYSLDSVLDALQMGHMQAWVIRDFKAVAVTSILQRPLHNVLWVQFLAGKHMDEWLPKLSKRLRKTAKELDCKAVEFAGRRGWSKINQNYPEYRPVFTIFRSDI